MTKNECDQCGKITEVKSYIWKFKNDEGKLDLCEHCKDALIRECYKLKEENK